MTKVDFSMFLIINLQQSLLQCFRSVIVVFCYKCHEIFTAVECNKELCHLIYFAHINKLCKQEVYFISENIIHYIFLQFTNILYFSVWTLLRLKLHEIHIGNIEEIYHDTIKFVIKFYTSSVKAIIF